MPRTSSLWLRARDQMWMTTLNGKQVKLSPDKAEARKLLHKLLAADDTPKQGTGVACRRLLDTYLAKTAPEKSAGRVKVQTTYFKKFCETFGHRKAESLKPFEVNDWLDRLPVAASTKALVLSMLKAGFAWGQREGYFAASPLKAVRKRKMARRERILTEAEVSAFLAACKPYWRDFFTLLRLTGMRPMSEAGALAAADLDHERKRAILWKHKNAKKTGKPRVIYFDPQAWEIVTRYAAQRPTGPIFRTGTGSPLTSRAMKDYVTYACGRAGVEPFPVMTMRHTMASGAAASGVPLDVLANLIGNSPATLRQHYLHMESDAMAEVMQKAAAMAAPVATSGTGTPRHPAPAGPPADSLP